MNINTLLPLIGVNSDQAKLQFNSVRENGTDSILHQFKMNQVSNQALTYAYTLRP